MIRFLILPAVVVMFCIVSLIFAFGWAAFFKGLFAGTAVGLACHAIWTIYLNLFDEVEGEDESGPEAIHFVRRSDAPTVH